MSLLAFLTAVLLALSGLLKIRSGQRVGVGSSPMAMAEVVAGVALAVVSTGTVFGALVPPRWAVPASVLLLLVSTIEHGMRLRAQRLQRADSEGGRLVAHVKYLSARNDTH